MVVFFVFLLQIAYEHQDKGGGPYGSPSIEAYCPFGGLESLYQFATTRGFIGNDEPSHRAGSSGTRPTAVNRQKEMVEVDPRVI